MVFGRGYGLIWARVGLYLNIAVILNRTLNKGMPQLWNKPKV